MSATQSASAAASRIVVFSLAEEEYALPVTQVQEIIRYTEPRSVASSSAWIRGVISLRGHIIPVCDLAVRLGLAADTEPEKIVIVETGEATAGILVDDVQEVLLLEDADVQALPVSGSQVGDGIAKLGDRLVVLLDTSIFAGIDGADAAAA
jgi:purine-binding chemotaxis protein CheW